MGIFKFTIDILKLQKNRIRNCLNENLNNFGDFKDKKREK